LEPVLGLVTLPVFGLIALAAMVLAGAGLLHTRRRSVALRRLGEFGVGVEPAEEEYTEVRSMLRRHRWIAVVVGGGITAMLLMMFVWPLWLAIGVGFVAGAVAFIVEDFAYTKKQLRMEEQIADGIDLMVSALRAGMSLVDAINIATEESRMPVRPALEEIVRRLRLGDNPDHVFHDFGVRVPLETSQVLAFSLTVHWRVGGSLAPALATVSQSARHRIEFSRRCRSQAMEGRASLIGMLGITYALTLLLWKAYPERFEAFFQSDIGIGLTALVLFLQGIGLVWTTLISRIKA
jgi:tight adherence protein B